MFFNPLVTVIIPFYNRISLTLEAFESVIAQTYRPIEIILVDDCSNESFPLNFIYASKQVSVHYHKNKKNLGPGLSRQNGVHIASGDFIHFLDSDDKIHPNFYQEAIDLFMSSPNCSFVYCFTKTFDSSGITGDRSIKQICTSDILPSIAKYGRIWSTSSCIWKSSVVINHGEWINSKVWEDYFFDIRVGLRNNQIRCLPKYYCFYRMDSQEKISNDKSLERAISKTKIIGQIIELLRVEGVDKPWKTYSIATFKIKFLSQIINSVALSTEKAQRQKIFESLKGIPQSGFLITLLKLSFYLPVGLQVRFLRLLRKKIGIPSHYSDIKNG